MVEPSFGHYSGTISQSNSNSKFTSEVSQLSVGYMGKYFLAGLLFERGTLHIKDKLDQVNSKYFDNGGVGTYIGFHFFDRLKLWTSYLNTTLEPHSNRSFRYFGQQAAVGLGYRISQGLLINAQYFSNQYTQTENDDTGKTEGLNPVVKTEGLLYSFSYILTF